MRQALSFIPNHPGFAWSTSHQLEYASSLSLLVLLQPNAAQTPGRHARLVALCQVAEVVAESGRQRCSRPSDTLSCFPDIHGPLNLRSPPTFAAFWGGRR